MIDFKAIFDSIGKGAAFTAAVGLLVSYINHRLNLRRDRRNDFNKAAAPIRERLNSFHNGRALRLPSALELQCLDSLMSWRERRRLREAIERCHQEYNRQHRDTPEANWSGIHDTDMSAVRRAIEVVLKELAPR